MSNEQVIELIRKGEHDKALDELYHNFSAFKNSFKIAGGKPSDAEDIFQDALLIFIEKVSDKAFMLTCNINSFLFSICRNLSFEYFRKKGKESNLQLDSDEPCDLCSIEQFIEQEQKYAALDKILTSVGKKCMEILSLFYISGLKMSLIAQQMGFKSETSAKTQKYKCIEKARELSKNVLVELQTQLS